MADLPSCFLATACLEQLVVAPERAVDQHQVARFGPPLPFGVATGQRRRDEDALPSELEGQSDDRLLGGQRRSQFPTDVIRILSTEGYGVGGELRNCVWIVLLLPVHMRGERKRKPLHWRARAAQDSEDGILFRQNTPDSWHGENFERLELPQVQQTHKGVDIGALQIDIHDCSGRPRVWERS